MNASAEERMVEEWNLGLEVPEIAERYAVTPAYVDRVLDDARAAATKKRGWNWSWSSLGNRIVYSLLAGVAINLTTGIYAFGTAVAICLFAVSSVIVWAVRSR